MRHIVDSLICLALAVVLFRTFQVEGYMISTGSMAPCLLGFHKRVDCPSCGQQFAFGVALENAQVDALSDSDRPHVSSAGNERARCPNCGHTSIEVAALPRNHGDQLLVHKNAYLYRQPKRWEVVVFRNPARPTQAYVKRIVGLPGESVAIVDGDIYVGGTIQRKDWNAQRSIRIPVYEDVHQPQNEAEWRPRWNPEPGAATWAHTDNGFTLDHQSSGDSVDGDTLSWVNYQHWLLSGGRHRTLVFVDEEIDDAILSGIPGGPMQFNPDTGRLLCRGALPLAARDRLLQVSDDPDYVEAIHTLYEQSHARPVSDVYGYNESDGLEPTVKVRDLMFSLELTIGGGDGEMVVEMSDGLHTFQLVMVTSTGQLRLHVEGTNEPVRVGKFPGSIIGRQFSLEMSLMDRQVLVAIDEDEVFEAWNMPKNDQKAPGTSKPARFGARGLQVNVEALKLYRDVYYTRKGYRSPYTLGVNDYYVLGDNSPISFDSRSWTNGAVGRHLFLGKPLLVHLPSRPGEMTIAGRKLHFRIPDFSRIRYIH